MRPAAMEMGSMHSLNDHNKHHDTPLPTPPDEKRAATVKRLSYVFGYLYCMFLILLALLILFKTSIAENSWSPFITIYVTVTGLIILSVLIVDIKLFTRRIRKQVEDLRGRAETISLKELNNHVDDNDGNMGYNDEHVGYNDEFNTRVGLNNRVEENDGNRGYHDESNTRVGLNPTTPAAQIELEKIGHSYCFAKGRHAGSVYLKIGAAAFALGHFVHTVLLVVTVHWSIAINNAYCINVVEYMASLLQCLFCLAQLFFIFTYSNLIILKQMTLARIVFLHMMAGNICLWFIAVATETTIAYKAYYWLQKEKNRTNETHTLPKNYDSCAPTAFVARMFDDYSAYLYPFTVEFNILVVGILFMIWRQIGKCRHSSEDAQEFHRSLYAHSDTHDEGSSPHRNGIDIHISCQNALCGLFSSLFVVVLLLVTIILGFVLGNIKNEYFQQGGRVFASAMKLVFHTAMVVATVVAFRKTRSLDVNKHPVPWLDDVLLYICVPAFFLESILTITPTVLTLSIVQLLDTIMMSVQMVIQIAFIIDRLRRCANTRKLRRTKPGQDVVLFLLVTNVAMWVMYTFSYQSPENKDVRYEYYGKTVWLYIGHICAPIIMFFRFHSSVCLGDIWSYAYKPGIEDH